MFANSYVNKAWFPIAVVNHDFIVSDEDEQCYELSFKAYTTAASGWFGFIKIRVCLLLYSDGWGVVEKAEHVETQRGGVSEDNSQPHNSP